MQKNNYISNNNFHVIVKRQVILLLVLLMSVTSHAQNNINGIWTGLYLTATTDLGQPKLLVEINDFKDSLFTGVTHLYYEGNKYEHYKIVGWYDKKDSILVYREIATIAVDLGLYGNCLGNYRMILRKEDRNLYQYGYWDPNIKACTGGSTVWLQKKVEEVKKIPPPENKIVEKKKVVPEPKQLKQKNNTPVNPATTEEKVVKEIPAVRIKTTPAVLPAKITQRETDVQSLVEITPADKDSIRVDVYDNGEIDGDSVSVYEEGVLRINKRMITAKPITFYVTLDKNVNPITHLRLVAESLGSIPPCTALMIVTTKTKRYEVHLSSNFNKNATVELFLKE